MVRPESGRGDHLISLDLNGAGASQIMVVHLVADEPNPVTCWLDRVDPEAAGQLDLAGVHQRGQVGGQPAAGGQLVGGGAALANEWAGSC